MNREEDHDLTVVVNAATDDTVVTGDETVAMNLGSGDAAGDQTVVVAQAFRDETVVVGGAAGRATAADTNSAALAAGRSQSGVPAGAPVAQGLDPRRPIAAVPGSAPWDSGPEVERGVSQGLPVSYRARPHQMGAPLPGLDEVQRKLGPAPAAAPVAVRQGREALPSLERRERRGRVATLLLFGAVLIVSVAGLWGLALIAFGW